MKLIIQARNLVLSGNFDNAINLYTEYLRSNPKALDIHHELIQVYLRCKKFKEASLLLEQILNKNPYDENIHANLGNVLAELGENERAIYHLNKALEINKKLIDLNVSIAECYRRAKKYELGVERINKILLENSSSDSAYFVLGLIYRDKGEHLEAIEHFGKSIRINPKNPNAHFQIAKMLLVANFYDIAELEVKKALKLIPKWQEARYLLGEILENISLYKAKKEFESLLLELPDSEDVKFKLVGLNIRLEKYQEAKKYLSKIRKNEINEIRYSLLEYEINCDCKQSKESEETINLLHEKYLNDLAIKKIWLSYQTEQSRNVILNELSSIDYQDKFSLDEKINLNFILGEAYDRIGNYDKAYEKFYYANEKMNEKYKKNEELFFKNLNEKIDNIIKLPKYSYLKNKLDDDTGNEVIPIFIVGASRSGKTWIEKMLSINPKIAKGFEIQFNPYKTIDLISNPNQINEKNSYDDIEVIKKKYLDLILPYTENGNYKYVTNTIPSNIFFLDIISQAFPNAPIIIAKRNILDVSIYTYFKKFTDDLPYAYDIRKITKYLNAIARLEKYWRTLGIKKLLEVNFEEAVNKPIKTYENITSFFDIQDTISEIMKKEIQGQSRMYQESIGHSIKYNEFLEQFLN